MNREIIEKRNRYDIDGDTGTLTVVRRDRSEVVITFDAADLDRLKHFCWRLVPAQGRYLYAFNSANQPLSHFVLGTDKRKTQVSYVDGNTLNVRRDNLKTVKRGSRINWKKSDGSGYVSYHQKDGRWYAYAWQNSRKVYLGGWPDRDSAIDAFRAAGDH